MRLRHFWGVCSRLAALVFVLGLLAAGFAQAAVAAECTTNFTGPANGDWMDPENWSAEAVPTAEDVACVAEGDSTKLESGAAKAEVVQGLGKIEVGGGTLTISGTAEDSNIGTLRMSGGARKGAATLFVTDHLIGAGGTLEGTGTTVSSAWGVISDPETEAPGLRLDNKHLLRNNGLLKINGPAAVLAVLAGSTLENNGSIEMEGAYARLREDSAHIVNSVLISSENDGVEITLDGGSLENSGVVSFASEATFRATNSARVVNSEIFNTWGSSTFSEGSELDNTHIFASFGFRAESSEVVNQPGAELTNLERVELEGGLLDNRGVLWMNGTSIDLDASIGAIVENSGELFVDSYEEGVLHAAAGVPPLENSGVLRKGAENQSVAVDYEVLNSGQVRTEGGELAFYQGATGVEGESWGQTPYAGEVVFADGAFSLSPEVPIEGELRILKDASVAAPSFKAKSSWIKDEEGALAFSDLLTPTEFGRLDLIGASIEVPTGVSAGAEYLGLAEGHLAVAEGGRWGKGYVDLLSGSVRAEESSIFEAGYIEFTEGSIDVATGAFFDVDYVRNLDGSVHLSTGSHFSVPSGFDQVGGSLTLDPGTVFEGQTYYLDLRSGTMDFGAGVEPNIYSFTTRSGEVSFGKSPSAYVDTWVLQGGKAFIAPESHLGLRVLNQGGEEFVVGHDSTVSGFNWFGTTGGTLKVEPEAEISGAVASVEGEAELRLEGASELALTSALTVHDGRLDGSGDTHSSFIELRGAEMTGTGATTVSTGSWISASSRPSLLSERQLTTSGAVTFETGNLKMGGGAVWRNGAAFKANSEDESPGSQILPDEVGPAPKIINTGSVEKTKGSGVTTIDVGFENLGRVGEKSGHLAITRPIALLASELFGTHCSCEDPIDTATGNFTKEQTDFIIPGWGVPLSLERSYSAQGAVEATTHGPFGYGWTIGYGDKLLLGEAGKVTAQLGTGATIPFSEPSPTVYQAPAWSQATLVGGPSEGFVLTQPDQTKLRFAGSGALQAVIDRNGNETSVEHDETGELTKIVDPAGRAITLEYDEAGFVKSAEDPMGHVVSYAYEEGELASVTLPGESSPNWEFAYDEDHRMTLLVDGRGGETVNEYGPQDRVVSQTDPMGRTSTLEYEPFHTVVTNEATGAVSDQWFTSNNEPFLVVEGAGSSTPRTTSYAYDSGGRQTERIDGNGNPWSMTYNEAGDRLSVEDAEGDKTQWTYNEAHQVLSVTKPSGEKTMIVRDANGNPETVSRPAPESKSQSVSYEYGPHGEVEAMTDPLGQVWTYGYDGNGDLEAETDPEGDRRSWTYDEDSRSTSAVAPRGNEEGAEPSEFTSSIERDPRGRPLKVTDPLGGATERSYDAAGNVESVVDPNGHETKFTYNANNELTKVERPSGAVEETGYDGAGRVISQTDGNGDETTYVRNVLGQPVEVIDPLERKTTETFDPAGNLETKEDPDGRTTSYGYDKADRLTGIGYSDGITPDASFGYDENGNLTSVADGTGESVYEYDQLDRLVHSVNGNGDQVGWEYDLRDEPIGLTYPNGKSVSRHYDDAGRLESVTDWLGHTTAFAYDRDSGLTATAFPTATGDLDEYAFDRAGRMSGVTMKKGAEPLASLGYSRDPAGQVEALVSQGLPGAEEEAFTYDEDERLKTAGADTYGYDDADNLTSAPGTTNAFDKASQLESATGATFTYDKEGERTKITPSSGPATTYGYDQAGNLTAVDRAEEGEAPAISEAFAYDGTGLLTSRTTGLATQHFVWDHSAALPLVLDDGDNSYLYGPAGLPFEQISTEEAPTYLHHDQLGSTRLLTDSSGAAAATQTFTPYGSPAGKTGSATTPLGFAGQYTMGQSGLIYLRARFYDPGTAQFMSVDPAMAVTRQPYNYAGSSPLNFIDRTGRDCETHSVSFNGFNVGPVIPGAVSLACAVLGIEETPEKVNEIVSSPVAGPVFALGCALNPECGIAESILGGLITGTASNLSESDSSCSDFVKSEAETVLAVLAGAGLGATVDAGLKASGSSAGLTKNGERILHAWAEAGGLLLELAHSVGED
jgi:RHS repeat-associated protein